MSADTTSIADDLLRNGYERWLRLEEAKAEVADDLKELMAELKGQGFTPKAVRESFRRVRDMDDTDKQEHDAIVELYVASLTRAHPAPAREKTLNNFGSASQSYAEAKGVEHRGFLATLTDEQKAAALAYRGDDTHGFEPTQEQPVERQRAAEDPRFESVHGAREAHRPATYGQLVTAGETATDATKAETMAGFASVQIPHSPASQASQALQADKTSEAVTPPPASSLVPPFDNPRCLNACHLAHSKDACHDCLIAWAARPKDEQIRLWAEANEAARAA